MRAINPCLWFEDQAEEAARHYVDVFSGLPGANGDDTRVLDVTRYGPAAAAAANRPEGSVLTVTFRLRGQDYMGLNGGPEFTFSEAISLMAMCDTQEEVDQLWDRLSEGGEQGPCGWLKDRFGLSWQVVPTVMEELMKDPEPAKAERVMAAMLQMKKLEIDGLRQAAERT